MKRLLMITPYPHNSMEMNAYIEGYFNRYRTYGYDVVREKIYFWENKLVYSLKWLVLLRYLFLPGFVYILQQHTIVGSGPFSIIFLFCAKVLRRKAIVVSHETVGTYAKHLPGSLRWIAYLYEWMVVVFSDSYIVHTKMHFEEIRSFAPVKHVYIIPHPVPADIEPARGEKTRWGFYGMIAYKKGVDLLLKAYQSFSPGRLPQIRIMGKSAPGEEEYEQKCRKMVADEYRELIQFTGFIADEDKKILFADIGLMIFPYRYITQSGALAETCMYGIPYLASDLSFFAEFNSEFGAGRLFTAESVESLRSALIELADNPLTISEEELTKIRNKLSIEKCAERLIQIILS